jgi:uncharacterized membrane protein YfcA
LGIRASEDVVNILQTFQSLPQLVSSLAYGAAIGAALGLTGSGGSILAVPALVYLVGEDVHAAIGTSLLVIAFNSFVGLATRFASASVEWSVVGAFLRSAIRASSPQAPYRPPGSLPVFSGS